jgi:DNA-binding NarL/FixJ family response regulator
VVRLGLEAMFAGDPEFDLVCVCRSQAEVIVAAAKYRPHLIIYSFSPDTELALLNEVQTVAPHSAIVLWSHEFSTELAHQAVEMGIRGFVSTTATPEHFKECLRISSGGEMWMERSLTMTLLNSRPVSLSKRQSQLVGLLVQGLKNKEIATSLGISEGTVKAYLTTLYEKVGAKDRFELALFGLKNLRNLQTGAEDGFRTSGQLRSLVAPRPMRRTVA